MTQYLALLRGINLGKRRIKMADLRAAFESWGHSNVRTLLASGNVVFESTEKDPDKVRKTIEAGFRSDFGWEVPTCVRRRKEIADLVASKPFAEIPVDHNQYVTFLADPPGKQLDLPYISADGDYRILEVQPGYVASALDRSRGRGTLDVMALLEEFFGTDITTRTWKTVMKIHDMMEQR